MARWPCGQVLSLDEQEIGVEIQAAIGNDAGFKRAQRAGGCVARIDGRWQALPLAFLVQAQEGCLRHDHFAANLDGLR